MPRPAAKEDDAGVLFMTFARYRAGYYARLARYFSTPKCRDDD